MPFKLELSNGENKFTYEGDQLDEVVLTALRLWVGIQVGGPDANKLEELVNRVRTSTGGVKSAVDRAGEVLPSPNPPQET